MLRKPISHFAAMGILILLFALPGVARGQSPLGDSAQMQAYYQKVASPGPGHALLAGLEGKWNLVISIWPAPGAEPLGAEGSSENKLILGGRFLECKSISGEGELYTEALTIYGYDNRYQEYTMVGFDTWGTYFVTAQGVIMEDGRTIEMHGTDVDPLLRYTQEFKMILEILDKDHYRSAIIFTNPEITGGAEEFKMIEIACARLK